MNKAYENIINECFWDYNFSESEIGDMYNGDSFEKKCFFTVKSWLNHKQK